MLIVPYVPGMLHRKTALTSGAEFVELPADDMYAYWRLITRLYTYGDDWCIVEQDIIISAEQIQELWDCPQRWCVFGYRRGMGDVVALGVFRLRWQIMDRWPNLLTGLDVPRMVPFNECDGVIYGRLRSVGLTEHRHYPNVRHEQSAQRVLEEWKVCREPVALTAAPRRRGGTIPYERDEG